MTTISTSRSRGGSDPAWGPDAAEPADVVGARERMRWFVTFWVMAMAFHHTDSHPRAVVGILVLSLPVLAWPTSAPLVGAFLSLCVAIAAGALPEAANHMVLIMFTGLAFGVAAVVAAGRPGAHSRDGGPFVRRWFDAARTAAGLSLLVVYGFTVFHKLNTAFFDPNSSCAGRLLRQALALNGLDPELAGPAVVTPAAVGTVVVEAVILVLLAVPGLRRWGLPLGVGFHSVLALASFYDFATTVFALYLLLVPTRVFAAVASPTPARRPRVRLGLRGWALVAFAVHVLVSLAGDSEISLPLHWHTVRVLTWYLAVLPYMLTLVRASFADQRSRGNLADRPSRGNLAARRWPGWRAHPALLLVPLLAFANGSAPYLGLKTVASYSMFSNLHTEAGHTNHLLGGVNSLQVLPYERDVVTVVNVEGPPRADVRAGVWMRERPPQVVPWLELRRVAALWRDLGIAPVALEYIRDGVPHIIDDARNDPELSAPMPWWQRRLLAFRAIDSGSGADRCRW